MPHRMMHLMAYLKTGPTASHTGAWRHPHADLHDIFSPERYAHIARVLEAARFDGCFYADTQGIPDIYQGSFQAYLRYGGQISYLDPLTILPIMAQATRHLGLGATLSTTFHHPYHLARTLASLDLLSGGRACWNIVTSSTDFEARNFGMPELPDKDLRYDHGDEVVEACCALWSCWDADALVMDRARGLFIDPGKVRYANYEGEHVKTRGPLSIPPSPQGRPVLMQAGSSPRGREFAARWAEAIFCSPGDKATAIALYNDIKSRMAKHGRAPEDCAVLPWMTVVLGETESIARERLDHLNSLSSPELEVATNSAMVGADLSQVDDAEGITAAKKAQGHQGLEDRLRHIMKTEGISFEQAKRRGKNPLVGTPAMIADYMQDLLEAGGCDGFVISPTIFPGMFEDFGRMVVPELQRRGVFRTDYIGRTMRENLRS
jgi:FMN-dependent oxidoreductase (nitrilotriacetate monooxygenase family)